MRRAQRLAGLPDGDKLLVGALRVLREEVGKPEGKRIADDPFIFPVRETASELGEPVRLAHRCVLPHEGERGLLRDQAGKAVEDLFAVLGMGGKGEMSHRQPSQKSAVREDGALLCHEGDRLLRNGGIILSPREIFCKRKI